MVKAGTYRDRVRIERQAVNKDAAGGSKRVWETAIEIGVAGEVSCQILERGTGMEFFGAGTEVSEARTRIRLREVPGFNPDPSWRFVDVDRGTIYEIENIAPTRLREELVVSCTHGGVTR
jgi:head-tail adaptor